MIHEYQAPPKVPAQCHHLPLLHDNVPVFFYFCPLLASSYLAFPPWKSLFSIFIPLHTHIRGLSNDSSSVRCCICHPFSPGPLPSVPGPSSHSPLTLTTILPSSHSNPWGAAQPIYIHMHNLKKARSSRVSPSPRANTNHPLFPLPYISDTWGGLAYLANQLVTGFRSFDH